MSQNCMRGVTSYNMLHVSGTKTDSQFDIYPSICTEEVYFLGAAICFVA